MSDYFTPGFPPRPSLPPLPPLAFEMHQPVVTTLPPKRNRARLAARIGVTFLIVALLGGVGVLGFTLHSTQRDLSASQAQNVKLRRDLDETQTQLSDTAGRLSSTQGELDDTNRKLIKYRGCLSAVAGLTSDLLTYGRYGVLGHDDMGPACESLEGAEALTS